MLLRGLILVSHLTNVENRLQKLEALFARLNPDVDLETALSQSDPTSPIAHMAMSLGSEDIKPLDLFDQSRQETPPYEALPQEADGFDWKEETTDVDDLADGMASLSVEPSGIGYLGRHELKITSVAALTIISRLHFWCRVLEILPSLVSEQQHAGVWPGRRISTAIPPTHCPPAIAICSAYS